MPKRIKPALLVFAIFLFFAKSTLASQPAPEPPIDNPHPPVTNADKKRVDFANDVITTLLIEPSLYVAPDSSNAKPLAYDPSMDLKIDRACLKNKDCLTKNESLKIYLASFIKSFGNIQQYKNTHIIPWSFQRFNKVNTNSNAMNKSQTMMQTPQLSNDEYMLHTYVKFKSNSAWHHMDIIVSEDAQGNIVLRRFFIMQIPKSNYDMPPGVVC